MIIEGEWKMKIIQKGMPVFCLLAGIWVHINAISEIPNHSIPTAEVYRGLIIANRGETRALLHVYYYTC